VILDLPGNRIQRKLDLPSLNLAKVQWHEIEEQRSISLRRHADQLTANRRCELAMDILQIGGLATISSAVIDNLAIDLALELIQYWHRGFPAVTLPAQRSATHVGTRSWIFRRSIRDIFKFTRSRPIPIERSSPLDGGAGSPGIQFLFR